MSGAQTILIEGKEYIVDEGNETAQQIIAHVRATSAEIKRIQSLLAIYETARRSYINALKTSLDAKASVEIPSDTPVKSEAEK